MVQHSHSYLEDLKQTPTHQHLIKYFTNIHNIDEQTCEKERVAICRQVHYNVRDFSHPNQAT